jgi:hypothetical protein
MLWTFRLFSLAVLLAGLAQAVPITWTLSGIVFPGGGTASGSFVYDADANTYSFVNLTTTAGFLSGATYTAPVPGANQPSGNSVLIAITNASLSDFTGTPVLRLDFSAPLTNAGGTTSVHATEGTCAVNPCINLTGNFRGIGGGTITGPRPNVTPAPPSIVLAITGMALAGGAYLWRRRRERPASR